MFRNIQHHLLNYFTKAYQKAFNIDIPLHINLCKIEDKGDYYSDIAETIIEQRKKKLVGYPFSYI